MRHQTGNLYCSGPRMLHKRTVLNFERKAIPRRAAEDLSFILVNVMDSPIS